MCSKFESAIVQTHIATLQGIISRMANYSVNIKTWCITLLTGVIVVLIEKQSSNYSWIGCIPITLFYLLDCYYLGLERCFRGVYDEFIKSLSTDKTIEQLLQFNLKDKVCTSFFNAFISFSTTPFYFFMYVIVFCVSKIGCIK